MIAYPASLPKCAYGSGRPDAHATWFVHTARRHTRVAPKMNPSSTRVVEYVEVLESQPVEVGVEERDGPVEPRLFDLGPAVDELDEEVEAFPRGDAVEVNGSS